MTVNAAIAEPAPEDELALARADVLAGDGVRAAERLNGLLASNGFSPELYYWLSAAYGAAGQKSAQVDALRKAETFHALQVIKDSGGDLIRFQQDPAYAASVGRQFYAAKLVACASLGFGRATLEPGAPADLLLSYGLSLQHQGRVEDATAIFAAAADAYPTAAVHEFLLYATFFVEDGVRRHAAEARRWAQRFAPPLDPARLVFENDRDRNRRLRVGYIAPSFVGTQVRQSILPVLEAHDPARVEVYLYAADASLETAAPAAKRRSIGAPSDDEAVALIRADQIDVLVDLWGQTAGGRLGVMARKPAPIQVAWMNYVQTTGLSAIDYVLHSEYMDVPGTDVLFTEKVWPLGPIVAPFRPDQRADPAPTPALKNGYITFGSFNNPAKLSDQTVEAWARVLLARPGSKLVLKYAYFIDSVLQNATCARFAAHGVAPERLEFRGHTAGMDYLREFQDIDLALDPSPCPGGTTSCDAIANGVPVLTQWGDNFYARIGVPVVLPCGLPELIADGWDDYVEKARALTADFAALDALRAKVRPGFDASAYRDEIGFTRNLEDVFRQMFERWLATPAAAPNDAGGQEHAAGRIKGIKGPMAAASSARRYADRVVGDFIEGGRHVFPEPLDAGAAGALLAAIRATRGFDGGLFLSESAFDADPQYTGVNPRPGRNLLERFEGELGFVENAPQVRDGLSALLGEGYQILNKKVVCGVPDSAVPAWLKARIAGNPVNNLGAFVRPEYRDVTYFYGIDFHQDLIDFKDRDADFVTLYVYLHAVSAHDAPLYLLEGSHKLGAVMFPHDLAADGPGFWRYRDGRGGEARVRQRVLTGEAGSVAMWHACTLHGTQPDAADHERISLRYLFARTGAGRAGLDEVNASLSGPLRLADTRVDLAEDGSARIKRNVVNRA